jgi:hypothetical protein
MNDVLHMLLGAALVCLGILATALADRVRQLRLTRSDSPGVSASVVRRNLGITRHPEPKPGELSAVRVVRGPEASARAANKRVATIPGSEDVIAALQSAGYKKSVATQAIRACSEQEQRSPEGWMAAALRRCA